MDRLETLMSWLYRVGRGEDPALRRLETLGMRRSDAPGAAVPLFFARRKIPGRAI
ncbi:hypothetical protein [Tabrizicola sp.]|uniref:hypothetical protein n=1 Tax=Tabrizicola sp. TaxID=2005166 RepID=UPI0035AE81CC